MRLLNSVVLGVLASALLMGAAHAADLTMEPPAVTDEAVSNWDGLYAGIGLGVAHYDGVFPTNEVLLIGNVGFNITADQLLFGAEGFLAGYAADTFGASGIKGGGEVRAGYLVTPEVLVYGSLGGYVYDGGATYVTYGAGVEFWVADNMSIDAEYKRAIEEPTPFYVANELSVTANWHF